ncbi:hypothetical protein BGZ60DRAFT_364637 [Tricladium varicosporioides]|nr:hypothetical protein BGZ60DRAFT_364637 [Hymenoscyphus varicosporioides]
MAPKYNLNGRTVAAPIAAFTMATLLFVYARTSIQAAKRNAQKHREADGGQINWHNENLRRHGKLEPPESQGTVRQLREAIVGSGEEGKIEGKVGEETESERRIREVKFGKKSP